MNAANKEHVRLIKRQEKTRIDQVLFALKTILASAEGRRVLHWILTELQPPEMWSPNAATVGYLAALYDFGNKLRQRIQESDPDALLVIATEAHAREKQEQRERDAKGIAGRNAQAKSGPDNENESAADMEE